MPKAASSQVRPLPFLAGTAAGRAKAGYMELVIAAALEWQLPPAYIEYLRHFLPNRPGGVTWRSLKEYGWT